MSTDKFNEEELYQKQLDDEAQEALAENEVETTEEKEALEADSSITEGTELDSFESAEIEEKEFIDDDKVISIIESMLFATDKAVSLNSIKQVFKATNIKTDKIRRGIEQLQIQYADPNRGVSLEEVGSGFQLRTKIDNSQYLRRMNKARPFKLSGPALEVLSIVAYKQPLIKSEVDQIRGVESGHLMRALMDRRLIRFAGKSELPGKPMLYETTKNFLEIFGLRSLRELPSLSEIDELIPEGIGEEEEKETLSDVTEQMGSEQGDSYSESEQELGSITEQLSSINPSTEFFEEEKIRERQRRDKERADEIQEAIDLGDPVENKDLKWLERYKVKLEKEEQEAQEVLRTEASEKTEIEESNRLAAKAENIQSIESDEFSSQQESLKTLETSEEEPLLLVDNEEAESRIALEEVASKHEEQEVDTDESLELLADKDVTESGGEVANELDEALASVQADSMAVAVEPILDEVSKEVEGVQKKGQKSVSDLAQEALEAFKKET